MSNLSTKQLTEYLKHVADLEMSVYRQEQMKKEACYSLSKREVTCKSIEEPKDSSSAIEKPEDGSARLVNASSSFKNSMKKAMLIIGAAGIMIALALLYLSNAGNTKKTSMLEVLMWFELIASIVGIGIGIWMLWTGYSDYRYAKKMARQEKQAYSENLKKYNEKVAAAKAKYKQEHDAYLKEKKQAEEEYNADLQKAENGYMLAEQKIEQMGVQLEQTKDLLNRFYDKGIVFAKYRNIVAMCTMYEYFAAGRCTALEGPDGAYNLYEMELRQNLIINQLELVNRNLEQVKQNQYVLYQGITAINQSLQGISEDIKRIANATEDMVEYSRITAAASQVTAENTAAIKYLELANG